MKKTTAPDAVTVNGKKISLTPQKGHSRGGSRRMRAMSEVPGLGRVYIVVYLDKGKRADRSPSVTPPVPRPTPPPVEDIQTGTLRVLEAMTRRLDAMDLRLGAVRMPELAVHPPPPGKGSRRPIPAPSA